MTKKGRPFGLYKNIEGTRSGHLVAVKPVGVDHRRKALWLAICDCGGELVVRGDLLTGNQATQCGCLRKLKQDRGTRGRADLTGDMRTNRIYRIYYGIISRTSNPRTKAWKDYGGRGIALCDEWQSFPAFHDWAVTRGYADHLTIDRRNNDGNYEPDNCRWATNVDQANNKRNSKKPKLDLVA